jgi:hypothetical protein
MFQCVQFRFQILQVCCLVGMLLKLCEIYGPVKRNSIAVLCEKWVKFKFEIAISLLANMYITMGCYAKVAMEIFRNVRDCVVVDILFV